MSSRVIAAHLRDAAGMDREDAPAPGIRVEPELDRELDASEHRLQAGDLAGVAGDHRPGIRKGPAGPLRLDKEDLPVPPSDQVHRGPGPGTPDHAEPPAPQPVPGKVLHAAAAGPLRARHG